MILLTGLTILSFSFSEGRAQGTADEAAIAEKLSQYGYSLSDLEVLGIDLNNPEQAIQRARSLGISESVIQELTSATSSELMTTTITDSLLGDTLLSSQRDLLKRPVQPVSQATADSTAKALKPGMAPRPGFDPFLETKGRFAGHRYFGYDLFSRGAGDFAAMDRGPADPGYVIGAGDVLRIYLWGDVEIQHELKVDNNGNIVIPQAGQFFVSGTKLSELREKLRNALSRKYSGLSKTPPTTFIDVNLAYVQGTQVYLMGEAMEPGSYNLPAFATVFNLMYTAGGPNPKGSLRELRILREGKIAARVDLYDYLALGQPTEDQRLRNSDIVFVPARSLTVAIDGEVNRPSIYEIKKGETLKDLLTIAGGVNASAYSFRVQVDRILPFTDRVKEKPDRTVIDLNLSDVLDGKKNLKLADGDIVSVFPYVDELKDFVFVTGGGITQPGRYALSQVPTVSSLISEAEGLTDDAYPYVAHLVRTREDRTRFITPINLKEAMVGNPGHDLTLMPEDSLRVFGRLEWEAIPQVSLRGFVVNPGEFLLPDDMTVKDLLFEYSGLQDSLRWKQTFHNRGDIYRLTDDAKHRQRISFNVEQVWNGTSKETFPLKDKDIVILYEQTVTEMFSREVNISGPVKNPGRYDLAEDMSLADLLALSGGFTEGAWVMEAEISRISLNGMPGDVLAEIINVPLVDWDVESENPEDLLDELMSRGTHAAQFMLQPYDQVQIRYNPNYELPGNVELIGEVMFPGSYTLQHRGETLYEVINRAGGLRSTAHAGGGKLMRNNRRLFLDFEKLLVNNKMKEDVILHSGDIIIIPTKPNSVSVLGAVINPGIYKFLEGKRAKSYLKESGGFTREGDQAFIVQPSGRTYSIGMFSNPKVQDGAIIRVYPKEQKDKKDIDYTRVITDTMAILSSALTIIVLAGRL